MIYWQTFIDSLLFAPDDIFAFTMKTLKVLGVIGVTSASAQTFPDCANGPVSTCTTISSKLFPKREPAL